MRRVVIILLILALLGIALWGWFGGFEGGVRSRVEAALLANGVPPDQAACMARDMTERLSIAQLRKLERLEAREGEAAVPRRPGEFLARLRRVDDPEAIRVTVRAAAACALGIP